MLSVPDDTLLLESGPVGTATVFSLILHVPLLLLAGLGGEKPPVQDVTPIFEAMYSRKCVESGGYSFDGLSHKVKANAKPLSTKWETASGPLELPRLLRPRGIGNLLEKDAALPPLPLPTAVKQAFNLKENGRTWFAWYASEIKHRITMSFPKNALLSRGITGEVYFRLRLSPDGSVRNVDILRSDHPALAKAVELSVKHAQPFPGYRTLGLNMFPPLNITCTVTP